jgi:hypothetical protein
MSIKITARGCVAQRRNHIACFDFAAHSIRVDNDRLEIAAIEKIIL